MAWSTAATLVSFINPNKKIWIYKIKRTKRVSYSLSVQKRELSSHKGELSPEIQMYNIYNVWQPSLVLGGLGRARKVPIAR